MKLHTLGIFAAGAMVGRSSRGSKRVVPADQTTMGYGTPIAAAVVMFGLSAIWCAVFWPLTFMIFLNMVWNAVVLVGVITGCRAVYRDRHEAPR